MNMPQERSTWISIRFNESCLPHCKLAIIRESLLTRSTQDSMLLGHGSPSNFQIATNWILTFSAAFNLQSTIYHWRCVILPSLFQVFQNSLIYMSQSLTNYIRSTVVADSDCQRLFRLSSVLQCKGTKNRFQLAICSCFCTEHSVVVSCHAHSQRICINAYSFNHIGHKRLENVIFDKSILLQCKTKTIYSCATLNHCLPQSPHPK